MVEGRCHCARYEYNEADQTQSRSKSTIVVPVFLVYAQQCASTGSVEEEANQNC